MALIKSKNRVINHGEVFTPSWMVDAMLDLVKGEAARIDARFLEPACGSGNFLIKILQRKLATVSIKFEKSAFDKCNYALLSLMCTYGVELLSDNVAECRKNMLNVFVEYLGKDLKSELSDAARYVLSTNIVNGDALTMRDHKNDPISFPEWGYLGKGKFQRRDFRFDVLTGLSAFKTEDSLFAHLGKHEIFTPLKTYIPMTVSDIARLTSGKGPR